MERNGPAPLLSVRGGGITEQQRCGGVPGKDWVRGWVLGRLDGVGFKGQVDADSVVINAVDRPKPH